METDLKTICDAIPVNSTGSVSVQASRILRSITGQELSFNIGGSSSQPVLPNPNIALTGARSINVTRDSSLGTYYTFHLIVKVNGVSVGSTTQTSLDVNNLSSDDVITAELSANDFVSGQRTTIIPPAPSGVIELNFDFSNWMYPASAQNAPCFICLSWYKGLVVDADFLITDEDDPNGGTVLVIAEYSPLTQQWTIYNKEIYVSFVVSSGSFNPGNFDSVCLTIYGGVYYNMQHRPLSVGLFLSDPTFSSTSLGWWDNSSHWSSLWTANDGVNEWSGWMNGSDANNNYYCKLTGHSDNQTFLTSGNYEVAAIYTCYFN